MMKLAVVAMLLTMVGACAGQDAGTPNELGLQLTTYEDGHVEGTLVTTAGSVEFNSLEIQAGVFQVSLVRDSRQLITTVDTNQLTADVQAADDFQITRDDRFVLTALATSVEQELGKELKVTDNLFRVSTLWGEHPEGALLTRRIEADPERGWTTLCYAACSYGYRTFYHSGNGNDHGHTHGNHSGSTWGEYIKFGRQDGHNPCNSRCGSGCSGVGTSAWTQDCGNHDRCEHCHTSACGGEWNSASDDFLFAGNCAC